MATEGGDDGGLSEAMAAHRVTSEREALTERVWATERGYLPRAEGAGLSQREPRRVRWARWPWSWT